MSFRKHTWALIACGAVGVGACGSAGGETGFTVTDSAGIRLVENSPSEWEVPAGWVVSPQPITTVGRTTDDTPAMLLNVEGAMRLHDGTIVVGDRGANQVKYFSPDGELLRVVGRKGRGPGEFEYLAWLKPCGADSAFTWDIGTRRLMVIAPDGSIVRSTSLESAESGAPPFGTECNRSGTLVTSGWGAMDPPDEPGPYRPMVPVGITNDSGEFVRKLGDFPGTEMVRMRGGAGPRRMGRWLLLAVSDSAIYVAPGNDSDIRVFDLAGKLQSLIRQPDADVRVTDADVEFMKRALLDSAGTTADRNRREAEMAGFEPPETLPPFTDLATDSEGNLWVQPYPREGTSDLWRVFRPDGSAVGVVSMPHGLHVLEIGRDYVLGIAQDESGAELVQVYGITKGS